MTDRYDGGGEFRRLGAAPLRQYRRRTVAGGPFHGDVAYTADFEGSFRDISPAGSEGYWLLTGGELLHAGRQGMGIKSWTYRRMGGWFAAWETGRLC